MFSSEGSDLMNGLFLWWHHPWTEYWKVDLPLQACLWDCFSPGPSTLGILCFPTASLHFAPYPQVLLHYHRKKQPSELREKLRQNSKPAILFPLKACHIVQKREETRSGKNTHSQKNVKPSPAGFCWDTMQASAKGLWDCPKPQSIEKNSGKWTQKIKMLILVLVLVISLCQD